LFFFPATFDARTAAVGIPVSSVFFLCLLGALGLLIYKRKNRSNTAKDYVESKNTSARNTELGVHKEEAESSTNLTSFANEIPEASVKVLLDPSLPPYISVKRDSNLRESAKKMAGKYA